MTPVRYRSVLSCPAPVAHRRSIVLCRPSAMARTFRHRSNTSAPQHIHRECSCRRRATRASGRLSPVDDSTSGGIKPPPESVRTERLPKMNRRGTPAATAGSAAPASPARSASPAEKPDMERRPRRSGAVDRPHPMAGASVGRPRPRREKRFPPMTLQHPQAACPPRQAATPAGAARRASARPRGRPRCRGSRDRRSPAPRRRVVAV